MLDRQSPDVESFLVILEQCKGLFLFLLGHLPPLPMSFVHLPNDFAQQSSRVDLSPPFYTQGGQVVVISIDHVVAKHPYVAVLAPLALVIPAHHEGHRVDLEDGTLAGDVPREVFI